MRLAISPQVRYNGNVNYVTGDIHYVMVTYIMLW